MADSTPPSDHPSERRSDSWLRWMVAGTVCVAFLALVIVPMFREPSREVSAWINTAFAVVGLLIGNIVKPLFPGAMPSRGPSKTVNGPDNSTQVVAPPADPATP